MNGQNTLNAGAQEWSGTQLYSDACDATHARAAGHAADRTGTVIEKLRPCVGAYIAIKVDLTLGAVTRSTATNANRWISRGYPRRSKKAARGAALFLLFIQLQAIIEMSLLRELGFGCRSIDAILERVRRYAEIEHLKAIVAEDEAEDT